jgi:15-cis-phytoene synthase / lycopene beta-cyclase
LIILTKFRYSFCRVADDLVDNAETQVEAKHWISKLQQYLDLSYGKGEEALLTDLIDSFPPSSQLALRLLPTHYLSPQPFYDLLKGFEMDLEFPSSFPIKNREALKEYGARVAGTVAELIIELVYHHTTSQISDSMRRQILDAGNTMGIALQVVNISRDIEVDSAISRVYIPTDWLKEVDLTPLDVVKDPNRKEIVALRERLLDYAMELYYEAKPKIEQLPLEARAPMRVAVESYMEIGRVLREPGYKVKAGRATVPKMRRISVAWKALCT